jgi:uncharacterized membrane protein
MKKHYHKRKKVVIDAIDGKIINEPFALKLSNIEHYLEKNGIKILRILTIMICGFFVMNSVSADSDFDIGNMTRFDLSNTNHVYILLGIFIFAIILLIFGLKIDNYYMFILSAIILFFIGIVLILNGFNVIISVLLILTSLILIALGSGL